MSRVPAALTGLTFYQQQTNVALPLGFIEASKTVLSRVEWIKSQLGNHLEEFIIGKTYIGRKSSVKFCASDCTTFGLKGVTQRWKWYEHQKKYDGLIVVGVATEDNVDACTPPTSKWTREHYILALEQRLLHHYAFVNHDSRLCNTSFHVGKESSLYSAYALYMAIKLKDSEVEPMEDNQQPFHEEIESDTERFIIRIDSLKRVIRCWRREGAQVTRISMPFDSREGAVSYATSIVHQLRKRCGEPLSLSSNEFKRKEES